MTIGQNSIVIFGWHMITGSALDPYIMIDTDSLPFFLISNSQGTSNVKLLKILFPVLINMYAHGSAF